MQTAPCSLLSLPDELISAILSFCNPRDIVRIEATCHSLRVKCQGRILWTNLLRGLDVHQAPNFPPPQSTLLLATSRLRAEVIKADITSLKWSHRGRLKAKQYTDIQIDDNLVGQEEQYSPDIRLLPGAREVVLLNKGRLELWSIKNRECHWKAPPIYDGKFNCSAFDCELSDDGRVVSIAWLFTLDDEHNMALRMIKYDLKDKKASTICEQPLIEKYSFVAIKGHRCLLSDPSITETILITCDADTVATTVILFGKDVDTVIQPSACLIAGDWLVCIASLPSFIIFAVPLHFINENRNTDQLFICVADWSPLTLKEVSDPDDLNDNPCLLALHSFIRTWVPESTRELFIAAYDNIQRTPKRFLSYRIKFIPQKVLMNSSTQKSYVEKRGGTNILRPIETPSSSPLVLVDKSVAPARKLLRLPFSVTNSGRIASFTNSEVLCFSLFDASEQPVNSFKLDGVIPSEDASRFRVAACVDPWSGAVAVFASGRVAIFSL